MNAARIVVPANALSAGGVAAYLARGSDEKPTAAEPVARPTTEILVAKSSSIARAPFIAGEPIRSEIILTNIRVLAIDQGPKEKEGMNALVGKTVTLELKPEQAETLACSRQAGTLALRSITDVNMVEGGSDDQAPKRGASINVARYGIASQSTAQK